MIKSSKISREKIGWMLTQPIETRVAMLGQHMEVCRLVINSILEEEVISFCGERYSHDKPFDGRYSRHGFNPGSVRLGNEKLPIEIPRVRDPVNRKDVALETYQGMKELPAQDEKLVQAVLSGLSTRDYKSVISQLEDSFGLSSSTVSRRFIERSTQELEEFEKRKLERDFVGLFIDGKALAKEQMIIALGVDMTGEKVPLGIVQASSENAQSVCAMLRDLIGRGLKFEKGLLAVVDGSKGFYKAIKEVFGTQAIVQRCQWHKRENVVSYLPDGLKERFRKKLQAAYCLEDYAQAHQRLMEIFRELQPINRAAANSLLEGLEETLTINRLGLHFYFHKSFATTNCIENVNSQLAKYLSKVKHWGSSDQRYRWVVSALLAVEQKLRKVFNFKMIGQMRAAIEKEIQQKSKLSNAA